MSKADYLNGIEYAFCKKGYSIAYAQKKAKQLENHFKDNRGFNDGYKLGLRVVAQTW